MKNNNIRYEIRIIGVTKQYNLVFPIKFKNMMHKEFESSVCVCVEKIMVWEYLKVFQRNILLFN